MDESYETSLADRLITYLRNELQNPSVQYRSPPTPLKGGYTTALYRFQLQNAPDELAKPLVLRVYPKAFHAGRADFEGVVQNHIAAAGYPAPRVFFICLDSTILGGEFIIMAFMPGDMMMNAFPIERVPKKLAEAHVVLHTIDPRPLAKALTEQGVFSSHEPGVFFEDLPSLIDFMETQITAHNLEWLKPGIQWLQDTRPTTGEKLVLCHGDFHPWNILVDHGAISAVLDWGGFRVWEPESDISGTKMKLTCVAPSVFPDIDWMHLARRYYECYSSECPIDQSRVEYFEAMWCLRLILSFDVYGLAVFGRPGVQKCFIRRFHEISGIELQYERSTR